MFSVNLYLIDAAAKAGAASTLDGRQMVCSRVFLFCCGGGCEDYPGIWIRTAVSCFLILVRLITCMREGDTPYLQGSSAVPAPVPLPAQVPLPPLRPPAQPGPLAQRKFMSTKIWKTLFARDPPAGSRNRGPLSQDQLHTSQCL